MSITLGRITLSDPRTWSQEGNTLSLSGILTPAGGSDAARVAELMATYYQISNLVDNPDEDVYGFSFSSETRLDGFYFCRSANITPIDRALDLGYAEWNIELERIPGFANPTFEITWTGLVRTNSHSITSGSALLTGFAYDNSLDYSFGTSTVTTYNKAATSCNLGTYYTTISTPTLGYIRNSTTPAYYYMGACKLEFQLNSTWYPWVGRQIPSGMAGKWRISNDLMKFAPNGSTTGDCDLSFWAGFADESHTFRPVDYSGGYNDFKFACGSGNSWVPPTVIRNDPEQVTLRFDGLYGHIQYMTIRRGCSHVEWTSIGYLPQGTTSPRPGVRITTNTASTSVTGGIRATSDDANGNRFVLGTHAGFTADTTNGKIYTTAVTNTATFCIGSEIGGSSTTSPIDAASIITQFMLPISSKTMVVAR